ncbi:MAG: hypothetical protein ACLR0P_11135 [Oscillospiraceae bacterium]
MKRITMFCPVYGTGLTMVIARVIPGSLLFQVFITKPAASAPDRAGRLGGVRP